MKNTIIKNFFTIIIALEVFTASALKISNMFTDNTINTSVPIITITDNNSDRPITNS